MQYMHVRAVAFAVAFAAAFAAARFCCCPLGNVMFLPARVQSPALEFFVLLISLFLHRLVVNCRAALAQLGRAFDF